MGRKQRQQLTPWQQFAIKELCAVAKAQPDELTYLGRAQDVNHGLVGIDIRLRTADLKQEPGGLPLHDEEDFLLLIDASPLLPPLVVVRHDRFVGYPHVLEGRRLCLYLDPAREWDPTRGFAAAIDRLYDWLGDAAAARFDADTALYHAVGGILHQTDGTPTVVVRAPGRLVKAQVAFLTIRTSHRHDLVYRPTTREQHRTFVFEVATSLPLGAGTTWAELLTRLDSSSTPSAGGLESTSFLTALAAAATHNPIDSPQPFILAIPHPAGGPPHLLAGRIPAHSANILRERVRQRSTPVITIDPETLDANSPVEWCQVSDERSEVTTRRDATRPISSFHGKTVHIWGCGGLGSWIAEFVARAGAKRLVLCDPGTVAGGLLVRQNYTENDIGDSKVESLRRRILAIRDDIDVEAHSGLIVNDLLAALPMTDLIIDATISTAIGRSLDKLASVTPHPFLAQVATDARTSTLGILTVSAPTTTKGPNTIDQEAGVAVISDGELEPFHTFWENVSPGDEVIPTRGCSVPTFHGSAADLAAVAAILTSTIGAHLDNDEPISGTHLMSLPSSPMGLHRRFIRASPHPT